MRATRFSRLGRIMDSKLKWVTAEPNSKERTVLRGTQKMFVAMLLAGLMLLLLPPVGSRAASFTVNSFEDRSGPNYFCTNQSYKGVCTLRIAITASNGNSQENTIYLPTGDYKLKSALPPITSPRWLTIQGRGAGLTSIRGSCAGLPRNSGNGECSPPNEFRVLTVNPTGALWLIGVTISDGQNGYGAGILNLGSLMVYTSTVKNNHAHLVGGGIYNQGWAYIQDTTVRNNFVHFYAGGGIFNIGTTEIAYSTISGNQIAGELKFGYGAGIANGAGSPDYKSLSLFNSTISGNESKGPNGIDAGGIFNDGAGEVWLGGVTITDNTATDGSMSAGGIYNLGKFYFSNTIIAGNRDGKVAGSNGNPSDCRGSIRTLGGNLVGTDKNCSIIPSHDWDPKSRPRADDKKGTSNSIINPQLAPLADNGGNTCTHALNPSSPAINNAWTGRPDEHPFACGRYDQRWVTRPSANNGGYNCDIGAFELTGQSTPLGLQCKE